MQVETPSPVGNVPTTTPSPLTRKALGRGEDTGAHDSKLASPPQGTPAPALNGPSALDGPGASKGQGTDREKRLFRLVDILRTEQVSAATGWEAEIDSTSAHRWRTPALVAAAVIVLGGAAILYASRPAHRAPDAIPASSPDPGNASLSSPPPKTELSPQQTGSGGTSLPAANPISPPVVAPVPERPAQGDAAQPPPAVPQAQPAPASPPAMQMKPVDQPAPQHTADLPPGQSSPPMSAVAPGSEPAKPALVVYFPNGSQHAEANARNLAAKIEADVAKSDIEAQSTLPDNAVISISQEGNHKLARSVGKSLGDLGYRWRIENRSGAAGAGSNMIEVWLPR